MPNIIRKYFPITPPSGAPSPAAVYDISSDSTYLVDRSGNGRHLTNLSGWPWRFVKDTVSTGLIGGLVDQINYCIGRADENLRFALKSDGSGSGAYTLEAIVQYTASGSTGIFLDCFSTGESLATNVLYRMWNSTGATFGTFWEYGAGTNGSACNFTGMGRVDGQVFYEAQTCDSTGLIHKSYRNGSQLGVTVTKTAPDRAQKGTSGNTQIFTIGCSQDYASYCGCIIYGVRLTAGTYTDAQIAATYQQLLGAVPSIANQNPAPTQTGVSTSTTIAFRVSAESISTAGCIDPNRVNVMINDSYAILRGVKQDGYTFTRTAVTNTANGFDYVITPTNPLRANTLTTIKVYAEDTGYTRLSSYPSYYFTTGSSTPPSPTMDWTTNYPTKIDTTTEQPYVTNYHDWVDESQFNTLSQIIRGLEAQVGSDLLEAGSIRACNNYFKQNLTQLTWSSVTLINITAWAGQGSSVYNCFQDGKWRSFTGTLTFNPSITGEGGLDTGSESNVWYYLYLVPTIANDNLLTVRGSTRLPTLGPTGYSNFKYIGAVKNTSGDLLRFYHCSRNQFVWTKSYQEYYSASGTDSSPVKLSLVYVPGTASIVELSIMAFHNNPITVNFYIYPDLGATYGSIILSTNSGSSGSRFCQNRGMVTLVTPQSIYYKRVASSSPGFLDSEIKTNGWMDKYLI